MKIIVLFFILAMILLCTSCNWFPYWNEEVKTELEKLPPATRSGEYTFGCLVNGKAFVIEDTYGLTAVYQSEIFSLSAQISMGNKDKGISFIIYDKIVSGKVYDLVDTINVKAGFSNTYYYSNSICQYLPDNTLSGNLTIDHFDQKKYIISGTFEFSAANDDCDTIHITDGRFDMKYIP